MGAGELLALGLALQPPWRLVGQRVDTDKQSPTRSFWRLPPTGESSTPARSMAGCARLTIFTNSSGVTTIFSNIIATYVAARVPRVNCPEHKTK
ncbi:hypothetical protein DFAR_2060010 [Desulfarculales bacterium]